MESVATPSKVPSLWTTNDEYFASNSLIVVARPSSCACHAEKVDRCSNLNCRDVSLITRISVSEFSGFFLFFGQCSQTLDDFWRDLRAEVPSQRR